MADSNKTRADSADVAAATRGADGVTVEELRRGRQEWWDDSFSALLLEPMPRTAITLVDLGCGTAHAAHALLPLLSQARYVGVDIDVDRIALCQRELAPWGERARAMVGDAASLPLESDSTDVVLTVTTLEHIADVPQALAEIRRVLLPGGRLVAVEPDNLCQMLRFEGPLPGLDEAFESLFVKLNRIRRPADLALGPKLPGMMCEAGFVDVSARVHTVQSIHHEQSDAFFERLTSVVQTIAGAGALPDEDSDLTAVRRLLARFRADLQGRSGFSLHAVPVWRCVGRKV